MIAEINLTQDELREILDSLHGVAKGEEDISMDLNLIADPVDGVSIYVRNYNTLQVLHEIDGFSRLDISRYSEFVFNSKTLHDLVKDADSDSISLRFYQDEFEIVIGDNYFTTPTSFTLNLVQESEFQEKVLVDDFIEIDSLEREGLLDTLNMMDSISPVVEFSITDGELWITVSDIVQGEGEVMKQLDGKVPDLEYKYPIRPLRDFLERMNSEFIDLYMTELGTMKLEVSSNDRTAQLLHAPRKES